jgi:transcriptional regulator of acetoin/glycerol metabolism
VQAKLLRVLETREVLALGASRARPVEFRLCTATHRSLRAEVASGRFREDLYFRIARPLVELAALRDRREDIPWFIDRELRMVSVSLRATAPLVEAALLRPWPGNVRELRLEIESAARMALGEGAIKVEVRHLAEGAGTAFSANVPPSGSLGSSPVSGSSSTIRNPTAPSREALESALANAGGNISQAARNLGVHRTQLRRWLIKHGLASASAPSNEPED